MKVNPASSLPRTHRACAGAWSGQRAWFPRRPMKTSSGAGSTPARAHRRIVFCEALAAAATSAVVAHRSGFARDTSQAYQDRARPWGLRISLNHGVFMEFGRIPCGARSESGQRVQT